MDATNKELRTLYIKYNRTMKANILCFILLFGLLSCQNNDDKLDNSPNDVYKFVQTVNEGKYESMNLPDFSPNDILLLLVYANDFQEIPRFPTNPLSSYCPPIFRLGECLLWTIESIKLNYNNKGMTFPSNVPLLIKKLFYKNKLYLNLF